MQGKLRESANPEEYASIQAARAQVRRQATNRCKAVDALEKQGSPARPSTIFSERTTLISLKEKLQKLDEELVKMFAEVTSEEDVKGRERWYDRCLEYELAINEALGKLESLSTPSKAAESEPKEEPISPDVSAAQDCEIRESAPKETSADNPVKQAGDSSQCAAVQDTAQASSALAQLNPCKVVVRQEEKVPKFAGDSKKFREWHEQFEAVVAGRSGLEKFKKLKGALVGDALKAISHISLTEDQFEIAMGIIKEEFGNVFSAQYAHVVEMMKSCGSKNYKNADKWHLVIPAISQSVKALKSSVKSFDGAAVVILPLILENLASVVRETFLRSHEFSPTDAPLEQLEAFLKFAVKEKKIKTSGAQPREKIGLSSDKKVGSDKWSKTQPFNSKSRENASFLSGQFSEGDHSCLFCGLGNHESGKCRKNLSCEERLEIVQKAEACVKCLRKNHMASKCRARANCKTCGGTHHWMVCVKKNPQKTSAMVGISQRRPLSPSEKVSAQLSTDRVESFLPTGYVFVSAGKRKDLCRILLDPGSQRSYIRIELAKAIGAEACGKELLVTHTLGGISSEVQSFDRYSVTLSSRFGGEMVEIVCLGIPTITEAIFEPATMVAGIVEYADHVEKARSKSIEILIGTDDLGSIWLNESVVEGNMIAQNSKLGWFTFGRKAAFGHSTASHLCGFDPADDMEESEMILERVETTAHGETKRDLEALFKIEMLGIEAAESEESSEREDFKEIFGKCIRRLESGRYSLKLPFNEKLTSLGDNERIALTRLSNLIGKSSQAVLTAADAEFANYLRNGLAEEAPPRRPGEFAHYLPLQIVKKACGESPEGFKIRIVKDAGSRSKDLASLNDVLHAGPNLLPNVLKVLTRFRNEPVAVVADIEKAFHQFEIDEEHRTFLRFFWRPNISVDKNAPVREFWAKCLDFGLVASPWLHQAGVNLHLESEKEKNPVHGDLIEEIQYTIYMDDISFGALNVSEAYYKAKTSIKIFSSGHFPLKKWACNSAALAGRLGELMDNELKVKFEEENFKFLGVRWDQRADRLGVLSQKAVQSLKSGEPSKRALLSGLARVFDPLGIISPVTIQAKMLLQKLWKEGLDWDETLSGENLEIYNGFIDQLEAASSFSVKRTMTSINEIPIRTELHAFADASKEAFGAVIYARDFFYGHKRPRVTFIMSKAKVTPNKGQWSIHRLELLAGLISTRLASTVREALGRPVDSVHFWSDNSAVIGWVKENPKKWKTFVANRVTEIQKKSKPEEWNYVSTKENPADLLSRGTALCRVSSLGFLENASAVSVSKFWMDGPLWLSEPLLPAPNSIGKTSFGEAIVEARKESTVMLTPTSQEYKYLLKADDISHWSRAVKIMCYVLRFVNISKKKVDRTKEYFRSSQDYAEASRAVIKNLQLVDFGGFKSASGELKVPKKSKIAIFCPFVDDEGLVRCRSRLEKSGDLSFEEKFPIILDGGNHLVGLLLGWIHASKTLHAQGISTNLHHVRSEYLILKARSSMNKVLNSCLVCRKFKAKAAVEKVPPLPAFRIDKAAPFAITGVDFAGPIYVRNEMGTKVKSYIVLFVCAVSRAVHLDLTPDLSTHEFLLSLRKFLSRFPSVSRIISDNASTFKRTQKELRIFYSNLKKPEIQNLLSNSQVVWEFITERAPTQGAFYERVVQMVKKPLRKCLGTSIPRFRELESILAEIELCINLRPITALPSHMCEIRALCPADLLFGYHAKARFPDSSLLAHKTMKEEAIILSKSWRKQQTILNGFWKRFRIDYLQQIRSAHERELRESHKLAVGDICLLADPSPSRSFWPLCRIVDLFGGGRSDLRQRSCLVKLGSGKIVKRPITSLYPLALADN